MKYFETDDQARVFHEQQRHHQSIKILVAIFAIIGIGTVGWLLVLLGLKVYGFILLFIDLHS